MFFLYNIFIYLFYFFVKTTSLFNSKIKDFVQGRNQIWDIINNQDLSNCIWFHVSSLGEFEQVRELIEKIKQQNPNEKILLTFFSPSGYNYQKNYAFADVVCYLPIDFKKDVNQFLSIVQPRLAVWVRYEFWYHILKELHSRKIPIVLLNGVFRAPISCFYSIYLKRCLSFFSLICVINEDSEINLKSIGYQSRLLPDTRIDRVLRIKNQLFENSILDHFCDTSKKIVIAGSSWPKDELLLSQLNLNNYRLIIVPHNVNEYRLSEIKNIFPSSQLYSNYNFSFTSNVLIVDTVGILSKIYRYGTINYVGGGFNKVVHSVLEPLVYLKPIFFGPNYLKNEEAKDLIKKEIAQSIRFDNDINKTFESVVFDTEVASNYIDSKSNSIQTILPVLLEPKFVIRK